MCALGGGALLLVVTTVTLVLPWRWLDPPTSAFMLQCDEPVRHTWVAWEDISRHAAIAVVAAEDQKFPDHAGFDFHEIVDALTERGRTRGASTISQQVVKNLYLWPERSLVRKGLEAWLTLFVEALWPKRRILEVYLNVAEFGPGTFGVGEAAWRFFDVPARNLTPYEGARLAAVLPSPGRMSPAKPSAYVHRRAQEIQRAVRALGGPDYLRELYR